MSAKLVIFHANCPDGFTAAWAAWRKLGDDAEYRPANYGEPPVADEDVRGRDVLLLDFSYPRDVLDRYASIAQSVRVLDHHRTAQQDLEGCDSRISVHFDMARSGAGIAWDYFHTQHRPAIVNYVEDRDLWRWQLPDSREVSEYLFSVPREFAEWDAAAAYLEKDLAGAVKIGEVLLRMKRERVKAVCKNYRLMRFGEHQIPVVNSSWDMSDVGEYLCDSLNVPAAGYYFDRSDKRQWGFRSKPGFDVSEICKAHGGGGHAQASGFTSEIGWEPRG